MAVRTAGSPPQPHLLLPRGVWKVGLPQGSGWIGRWVSHALPHARRPRVTGPQGADTELVRSEKRPLAAAKMSLTSARGHFRLLRRWQWPARRQCRRWGQQVWAAAARRRTSRGARNEPGQGGESKCEQLPRRTGRAPRSIGFALGWGLAEANTSNLHTSTSPTPCGPCCDD
jgi:hypothetical protein